MKKVVKGLVIAASVAAVAGLGAVSFAQWSGETTKTQDVTGSTGTINTVGELTVTPTSLDTLYPVDQGSSYTTYWEIEVKLTGTGEQTVKLQATYTQGDGTEIGEADIYVATSAPEGDEVSGALSILGTEQTIALEEGEATIYVYLTADNTDAMGGQIKLTFTATATE